MAIQRQVNNLRCGDIVVMHGYNGSADATGYVVDTDPDTWDEPAVLPRLRRKLGKHPSVDRRRKAPAIGVVA